LRGEIATAGPGSVIGIHPFDQPDVEASKVETKALTSAYEKTGALPSEKPCFEEPGLSVFADARSASKLSKPDWMRAFLGEARSGDYVGLLAYVEMNAAHASELTAMRREIRDALGVATCVGFGPRFLHSTGQAYKGGPNSGLFVQITCADAKDLPVPGQKYTFGVVKAAQARGDFAVLVDRGRRAVRVHLTGDVRKGLARLREIVHASLAEHAAPTRT
jgi:transaldolase/glucose-6-phosphate isomerase